MFSVTSSKVHAQHLSSWKTKTCRTSMSSNILNSNLPVRHEDSALVKNYSAFFILTRLSPSSSKAEGLHIGLKARGNQA